MKLINLPTKHNLLRNKCVAEFLIPANGLTNYFTNKVGLFINFVGLLPMKLVMVAKQRLIKQQNKITTV
jgi:hypothetical protein